MNCINCGRKTKKSAKICNSCYQEDYDEFGISGQAQEHWDETMLAEHRERLKAHRHRVELEMEAMRAKGLDPLRE